MESVGSIIMYLIIALSIVLFSVLTVTTRKILRSATFLLFTLFATAALYFKLDYEFLGAVQIAVYAGGIVVLFVFSILLTSHPGHNSEPLVSKQRVLGALMRSGCRNPHSGGDRFRASLSLRSGNGDSA